MRQIAIAVRDTDLFLLATVVRASAADVYVNWPRDHVLGWKPHTSYHASGQHHQKSFGKTFAVQKKQKPDPSFKGTVNLVSFGVATGEHTAINGAIQRTSAQFSRFRSSSCSPRSIAPGFMWTSSSPGWIHCSSRARRSTSRRNTKTPSLGSCSRS